MAYAAVEEERLATKLGYAVFRSEQRGSSFSKGQRHIWSTRMGWQTADLINGYYRNHLIFDKLSDALGREI